MPLAQAVARREALRALGVSTAERVPTMPGLPTLIEQGVRDFDVSSWYGIAAPAKTPPEIVARLYKESAAVLQDRATLDKMDANDFVLTVMNPEQFGAYIRSEIEKWGKVVKATGARAD